MQHNACASVDRTLNSLTAAKDITVLDLVLTMAAIRLPNWATQWLAKVPTPIFRAFGRYQNFSKQIATELMRPALEDPREREKKDVTGLLASSFHAANPADRL